MAQHARGNFTKKIECDPYVTLVFFNQKISPHTTLRMTMYLVFEKTNILKLFNSRVDLSTSLMCALRIFHWNLIAGNFFLHKIVKKLIVGKNGLKKCVHAIVSSTISRGNCAAMRD